MKKILSAAEAREEIARRVAITINQLPGELKKVNSEILAAAKDLRKSVVVRLGFSERGKLLCELITPKLTALGYEVKTLAEGNQTNYPSPWRLEVTWA